MSDDTPEPPESLLPYDGWVEDALRGVVIRALAHVAAEGLPGDHHFYISFRTDHPGVEMPDRLRAQYAQEMTIILQHQFWDLAVDEERTSFSVGLSFSGIPSRLVIPFASISAFSDPAVNFALRFTAAPRVEEPAPKEAPRPAPRLVAPAPKPEPDAEEDETPQVVSLEAFRRKNPPPPSGRDS